MKYTTNRAATLAACTVVSLSGLITSPAASEEVSETKTVAEQNIQEAAPAAKAKTETEKSEAAPKPKKKVDSAQAKMDAERSKLAAENALAAEKMKKELNELQAKVAKLKLEKELLTETLAVADLEEKAKNAKREAEYRAETKELSKEVSIAKMQAEGLGAELKAKQAEMGLALTKIESEIKTFEAKKQRDAYADGNPIYLEDPLKKDGTLVISDRRIELNGMISSRTADYISERINYFNNKDSKFPIFIVIDSSPGGSVMAGMNILNSMHGSEAPVYVVVKSMAASMAASITTLAERSFAYPDSIILHHQVLSGSYGNLSETREHTRQMEEWWRRLATPVAKKMGISREEFIKRMYAETVTGDWTEFGDQAKKLKWVDHVVNYVQETSLLKSPDAQRSAPAAPTAEVQAENILPRLNPKDMLYLYNPDGYYKMAE